MIRALGRGDRGPGAQPGGRQAAARPAGRGGGAAADRQPGAPQRARPRDPRRDRRGAAAARRRDRHPLRADHRHTAALLGRLRHRRVHRGGLRARGRGAGRASLPGGDGGDRRPSLADRRRDQRALPRRRARAGGQLRPADRRGGREARHAAGQARPDLQPHRAAPLPRDDRPAAHPRDVLHRPQPRRDAGRADRAGERGGTGRADRGRGDRPRRHDRRRRAALGARQQARDRRARRQPGAVPGPGGGAGRAAPLLLRLGRLPRGRPRLCREAPSRGGRASSRWRGRAPRLAARSSPPPTR